MEWSSYNIEEKETMWRWTMVLETERLILRPWKTEDLNSLYEMAKNPYVGPPCGWSPHKDIQESQMVLEDILINDYTFALVLKETREVIGNISLMPYSESRFSENENEAEVGFWLGYPYWGKAYMPEACQRIIVYAFEEKNLKKVWCAHNEENHNSKRVQEKSGFTFHHKDSYYAKELDKRMYVDVNCIVNSL